MWFRALITVDATDRFWNSHARTDFLELRSREQAIPARMPSPPGSDVRASPIRPNSGVCESAISISPGAPMIQRVSSVKRIFMCILDPLSGANASTSEVMELPIDTTLAGGICLNANFVVT